jgi:hypothetical protein
LPENPVQRLALDRGIREEADHMNVEQGGYGDKDIKDNKRKHRRPAEAQV